ncbi:MAG: HAD family hydrolase [Pseudomonadota bacterium]|nr:HAD family hydrolase [Pseudomonadota bacterium]
MIRAITFDLWDTIVIDDSDEEVRKKMGLPSKPLARLKLLSTEIKQHHKNISEEKIAEAFALANEKFNHHWKNEHFTPTVSERLGYAYESLGIKSTPGFENTVHEIELMEVEIMPLLAPGIEDALKKLSKTMDLAIISDAIHTPGTGLRQILKKYNLQEYFSVFVFSDEAGVSKPSRKVFELAQKDLGFNYGEIAHIGDRESNDVTGPNNMGMKSILYTGIIDRASKNTKASAICQHHSDLVKIVRNL